VEEGEPVEVEEVQVACHIHYHVQQLALQRQSYLLDGIYILIIPAQERVVFIFMKRRRMERTWTKSPASRNMLRAI